MKIITLTEEEFNNFSNQHKCNTYYQSVEYANFAKANDQYNVHYLGFVDEDSDRLIGASLMLYKTLFWGYKYAYSPRGLLIDYEDEDMINTITKELKSLLRKQKFIFITIDPLIVASERDQNGKIMKFNDNVNRILNSFQNNNYEHLGFNLYSETILPRWNVVARLDSDARILYNNFDSNIKEKITYANDMALFVEEDTEKDINRFYEFIKKAYAKKGKKFFENLYNSFNESNRIKIFYAKMDTKKYTQNANKLYSEEEEKNLELAEIIQTGDTIKYNIPKVVEAKIKSDKLLHTYKKDIVASTKLLKAFPNGITCAASLTIENARGVDILVNYADPNYIKYYPDTLLTYEIMKYFGKLNYKYINIGPVTGNFDSKSKYYPILESKLGFNSSILEYIGQFNIVLNPTMYTIYKKKYNK